MLGDVFLQCALMSKLPITWLPEKSVVPCLSGILRTWEEYCVAPLLSHCMQPGIIEVIIGVGVDGTSTYKNLEAMFLTNSSGIKERIPHQTVDISIATSIIAGQRKCLSVLRGRDDQVVSQQFDT